MITVAILRTLRVPNAELWAPLLKDARPDMLANILHETGRLRTLRESLNYTPASLLRTWPNRFTPALANTLGRIEAPHGTRAADQWWIAEHAYGGRMGNQPAGHGDGWTFRGVGCLQTTGRANVEAFGRTIGWNRTLHDLADYMATPAGAAESAFAWWDESGCARMTDCAAIRRRVNGGSNGLAEVQGLLIEVRAAMAPPRPAVSTSASLADVTDRLNSASLKLAKDTK